MNNDYKQIIEKENQSANQYITLAIRNELQMKNNLVIPAENEFYTIGGTIFYNKNEKSFFYKDHKLDEEIHENDSLFTNILKKLLLENENDYNQQSMDCFHEYGLKLFLFCSILLRSMNIPFHKSHNHTDFQDKNDDNSCFSNIKLNTMKYCQLLLNPKKDEEDDKNENFWLAMNYTLEALVKIDYKTDDSRNNYVSFIKTFAKFFFQKSEEKADNDYKQQFLELIDHNSEIDIKITNNGSKITISIPDGTNEITIDSPLSKIQNQIEKSINKEESK
jgi:hypothetical protein